MSPKKKVVIRNKVKDYCESKGIDRNQFVAKCISAPLSTETGRALTIDTVTRIYGGETGITLPTAALVAAALGVELSDLFEIENGK